MVKPVPARADPIARPSQLFLAMFVEPIPGMIQGNRNFKPLSCPNATSRSTAGKIALSLSASIPSAPTAVPIMLKCE